MSQLSVSPQVPAVGHRAPSHAGVTPTTSPSGFSITIRRVLGVVVVTVHGTLDTSGCAQLKYVLEDLIDNQGNLRVVVDLLALTGVEGRGLAVFQRVAASATRRGGELILADPCDVLHGGLPRNWLGGRSSRHRTLHAAAALRPVGRMAQAHRGELLVHSSSGGEQLDR